ncbi:transporter substrate-binding domain-containing protein [Micromonospora sp. CA-246542]|uniref:transporter substrate-binding domain-containing protein n=1 Tax=Micromonospora sp. CA-246542 TaxID=3239959 RepID=UPI003D947A8E
MEEKSPSISRTTPSDRPNDGHFWRRQALWLVPALVACIAGTVALAATKNGVNLATILAVPIGASGVMVGILALNLSSRQRKATAETADPYPDQPRQRRYAWEKWASAALSIVLICSGAVMAIVFTDEDPDLAGPNAEEYLTGIVEVGINGEYPGWSYGDDPSGYNGFDVALARWLGDKFDFEPKFRKVDPASRLPMIEQGAVKLVVSNFSINSNALAKIDMAGPYYQDESAIWMNFEKRYLIGNTPHRACVARNTTNADKLANSKFYDPDERSSLADCLSDFFNPSNDVALMVSDKSILEAYRGSTSVPVTVFDGTGADVMLGGTENYGIGFPNGYVELCKDLSDAIDEFIETQWSSVFDENLRSRGVSTQGHRPSGTSSANCKS